MVDDTPGIPGKQFVRTAAIGCLLFAAILGFGTYFLGVLTTPYLKKRNEEYLRTHRPPANTPVLPSTPPVAR